MTLNASIRSLLAVIVVLGLTHFVLDFSSAAPRLSVLTIAGLFLRQRQVIIDDSFHRNAGES